MQQAADDALVAIIAKLGEFRGESRFTTWAYKFVVLLDVKAGSRRLAVLISDRGVRCGALFAVEQLCQVMKPPAGSSASHCPPNCLMPMFMTEFCAL